LTKADAQKGVDKALVEMTARFNLEPSRSAMVIGIVENQQENTAVADVTFSHFVFPCAGYSNQRWTSGKALFQHYTDGHWILTQIDGDGFANMICATSWRGRVQLD
jgi:hypothetical protein